jgi:hypothetical protein
MLERLGLPPLIETSVEILGVESHFGAAGRRADTREVDVKIAARHVSAKGIGVFLKEMVGLALTAPPGLTGFAGARPKPTPVVRLFSMLLPKAQLQTRLELDGEPLAPLEAESGEPQGAGAPREVPTADPLDCECVEVPLEALAFGRSGDKGDKANIGIMARREEYLPWIAARMTADYVADYFVHFLAPGQAEPVQRFYLPGAHALNFLLHDVLGGGGVASLRADPQGKGYAQLLLTETVAVPRSLAEAQNLPIADAA